MPTLADPASHDSTSGGAAFDRPPTAGVEENDDPGRSGQLFTFEVDRRCLRGLRFVYRTPTPYDQQAVAKALQAAFPNRLVIGEELLGNQLVVCLIFQFRFEVRLGRHMELLHRVGCDETRRIADRAQITEVLSGTLSASR